MPEKNQVLWRGVRGTNPPECVYVTPLKDVVTKRYKDSLDIAAGATGNLDLTPPSGYKWIVYKIKTTADPDVSGTLYIDDNAIEDYAAGVDLDIDCDSHLGPFGSAVRTRVRLYGSNAGTITETITMTIWVYEVPDSLYMV